MVEFLVWLIAVRRDGQTDRLTGRIAIASLAAIRGLGWVGRAWCCAAADGLPRRPLRRRAADKHRSGGGLFLRRRRVKVVRAFNCCCRAWNEWWRSQDVSVQSHYCTALHSGRGGVIRIAVIRPSVCPSGPGSWGNVVWKFMFGGNIPRCKCNWQYHFESGVRVTCDGGGGYRCANFSLPRPMFST